MAAAFEVADTMLKTVRLILSRSIYSGNYAILIGGEIAERSPGGQIDQLCGNPQLWRHCVHIVQSRQ